MRMVPLKLTIHGFSCEIQHMGIFKYHFTAVLGDYISESVKKLSFVRLRDHNMITVGAAECGVVVRIHFATAMEVMLTKVHVSVIGSVMIPKASTGITCFWLKILIIDLLDLCIKLFVRCFVIRFCQHHGQNTARLQQ